MSDLPESILAPSFEKLLVQAQRNEQTMFGRTRISARAVLKTGVGVLVRDEAGRILLERRSDCGLWGLLGGSVHPGETITQTVQREVEEESGLLVKISFLVGVYSDPEDRIVVYPDNGDERHLIDIVLEAEITGGKLRISQESLELHFFSLKNLPPPEMFAPPARKPVADYLQGYRGVIC